MRAAILCTDAYGGHGGIALYDRDFTEALALYPAMDEVVMVPRLIRGPLQPIPENVRFVAKAARGLGSFTSEVLRLRGRRDRFDIVFCAHVNLLPFARMLSRRVVLLIYGIEAWKPVRPATKHYLDSVASVISISDVTLRRFRLWSKWHRTAYLVPNAIHLDRYGLRDRDAALARRLGLEGKRVLMTLGRIEAEERYKGFDEVIELMPGLLREHPDLAYVVAGGGPDLPRLQAKAAALGLADQVVFTGLVREEEKAALYSLAEVYVMPSHGEGFGFVLLEALASGVPVIASRIDGGYEAIRQGELGRAVDPSNPAEIRAAILDRLAKPVREVPAGLSHFAFDRFVSRVHSAVESIRELK